jgi:peptidoglycan/xylan/chitin deacetylase (PgdA/CDA1 family)
MRRRLLLLLAAAAAAALLAPGSAGRAVVAKASVSPVVVTIQFDDGNANQFTDAYPILQAHGMLATFYVNTGVIGDLTHMSWADLTTMYDNGNGMEIAGHTLYHTDIKKLKPADARVAVCQDRDNLIDHGFTPESFAYPFGSFDAGSEQIVAACGYNSGRGVAGGTETIPPLDAYATRTPPNPKKGTKLRRIEGYITDAQNNGGGWVQLVFHNVCIKCDAYQITPTHFTELLDWIQGQEANGVTVKTTAQVIGGPFNPAVAP